jgi:hypothetical protein
MKRQNAPMIIKVSAIAGILNSNKVVVPVKNKRKNPSILCGTLMWDLSENTPIYRIPLDCAIKK